MQRMVHPGKNGRNSLGVPLINPVTCKEWSRWVRVLKSNWLMENLGRNSLGVQLIIRSHAKDGRSPFG